jgi:cysteine synthase
MVTSATEAVGNTPLVRLRKIVPSGSADVYVKLESLNPTGSYKDRMALAMIEEAEKRGELRPGMKVVEYTGGSTGSSLAFVCAVKGYAFHVVSSDAFAREKLQTMRAFGAELEVIPSQNGQITRELIQSMIDRATEIARDEQYYFTDQFNNRDSLKGYAQIGEELVRQLDGPIDVYCGGVGTAGMLMGVATVLKGRDATTRIVGFEPASSAVITTGQKGAHHVEGIGVGFVPPLLDSSLYDEVRSIEEDEARKTARLLAREEGILAGTSSGLNVAGALQLAAALGPGHKVVTVAVDTGLKYLAGDLYSTY